jgi:hypothetical protein
MGSGYIYNRGIVRKKEDKKGSNWVAYCEARSAYDFKTLTGMDFPEDYHVFIRLNKKYSFKQIKRLIRDYKPKLDMGMIRTADILPKIERMIRQRKRRFGKSIDDFDWIV